MPLPLKSWLPEILVGLAAAALLLAEVSVEAQRPVEWAVWLAIEVLPMASLVLGVPAAFRFRREMKKRFWFSALVISMALFFATCMTSSAKSRAEMVLLVAVPVTGIFSFPFALRRVAGDGQGAKVAAVVVTVLAILIMFLCFLIPFMGVMGHD